MQMMQAIHIISANITTDDHTHIMPVKNAKTVTAIQRIRVTKALGDSS